MSKNSRIRDNNMYGKVADFLQDKIQPGSSLSIVSAYFTIYAFDKLRNELTGIKKLRFLFGDPSVVDAMDPRKKESKTFRLTEDGLEHQNPLSQSEIARACADWIKNKVEIKSARSSNLLHGKMYYIAKDEDVDALIGSSNFTVRGLGLSKNSSNIELNLEVNNQGDCADLKDWFDDLWESDEVQDVKEQVLKTLEDAYQDRAPEFIYYKTLYHLFEEFLEDADDTPFFDANPQFQETEIWKTLFPFQKHGVQAGIKKLKEYNGCIIADSVGLGKTYEALAIIKYFELRNYRVLVLCPKKLEKNWTLYPAHYNNKYNPLKKDSFRYSVFAHTDLSRDSSALADIEWDGFDLVVIDESHNFRNRGIRYNKLLEDVIQSGGKTQVLMLSATPVNNRLTDLENQISLITEDKDDAFKREGILSIKSVLKAAQDNFETWITETNHLRDESGRRKSLLDRLNADFFSLLDKLTIARSRKQIRKFYEDSEEQRFPSRKAPKSIFPKIDRDDKFPSYQEISNRIDGYKLSLFNPSKYIKQDCLDHYGTELLKQREFNLIGMMKVNFLKRLESSVYSFTKTLESTLTKIKTLETKIHNFLNAAIIDANKANKANFDPLDGAEKDYEEDEDLQTSIQAGKKQTYHFEHLDLDTWLKDLGEDKDRLEKIYRIAHNITPERDAKLAQLQQLIDAKVKTPTKDRCGKDNRKVLVFTAFADTAKYLYNNLYTWATDTHGIHAAVVTGSENKTFFEGRDFNEILTNFSPISKDRKAVEGRDNETEIDLLIATDCISEGQNLQDCDYLINFDIHWNPVRIIQRFGRIDRLRSRNEKIQLVNFWPTPELDEYINLKTRVEARMALVDLTATGDDDVLSLKERDGVKQVWTHRDRQLRRMKTENLDFEDIEEQVNINQFTLDDFRSQLLDYLRGREDELEKAPLGLYAVTGPQTNDGEPIDIEPGVIFCLKQTSETKENEKLNPIYPYYLVYVSDEGKVSIGLTNPKRVLEGFSTLCVGKTSPDQNLCQWFNETTASGNDMTDYELLIDEALDSIRYHYDEKLNTEILSNSKFMIPTADEQIGETTEFELITWLVIRKNGD